MSKQTSIPMPVLNDDQRPRRSRVDWRVWSLVLVHVLMISHGIQWLITGTTVSPIEPSESMETIKTGAINAGFIFFGIALLLTLIFGRFVCGWACHFVAYQDLSRWLLRKVGIQPKPLRARLLMFVPLGMALYMFVWPAVYRIWVVARGENPDVMRYFPQWSNGLVTQHFWETFPGWLFAIISVSVAGFAIVYFLGAKGFCTYGCPYGGFFSIADRVAPMRVRVSEACDQSGVCTTVCSSNVDVASEVLRYGMVVSPGCMKCGDCLRACPNDALSWRMGKPALVVGIQKESSAKQSRTTYDLPWWEEVLLLALFLVFLLSWRGLYGGFPFLMSAGLASILAYVTLLTLRLTYRSDVALQNKALRATGRVTRAGYVFALVAIVLVGITGHSAYVQAQRYIGNRAFATIVVGDVVRDPRFNSERDLSPEVRTACTEAADHYTKCAKWGFFDFPDVSYRLSWVNYLLGDDDQAIRQINRALNRAPHLADAYHLKGLILRAQGDVPAAIDAFRSALVEAPSLHEAGVDLGNTLLFVGQFDDAVVHFQSQVDRFPDDPAAHYHLGALLVDRGEVDAGIAELRQAVELKPDLAEAHYQLGYALLSQEQAERAITALREAVRLNPAMAPAHYNLAVAHFMLGDKSAALQSARRAVQLDPRDTLSRQFLHMLETQ